MTGISIDKIVTVNAVVDAVSLNPAVNAGLYLTKNAIIPTSQLVKRFNDAEAVGEYFGTTSVEYARALNYFKGDDNSTTFPPYLLFARYFDTAAAPYTRGAAISGATSLAALNAITSGTLSVIFDNVTTSATSIDLSSSGSYSLVAATLQAALVGAGLTTATVTYDSITKAFTISNGVVTGISTVEYCPITPLATALAVTEATGSVLSQGSVALTESENMDNIVQFNPAWVNFSTIFSLSGSSHYSEVLAFNEWVSNQSYKRVFLLSTTESNLLIADNTSNIVGEMASNNQATLQANGTYKINTNTAIVYNSGDVVAMWMGVAAAVDYTEANSAVSFAFKHQSDITPLITTDAEFDALLQKSVNFYGLFKSNFNNFNFSYSGVAGTAYIWLDFLENQAWLQNTLQDRITSLLVTLKRLPNNSDGSAILKPVVNDIAQQAINAGVITIGESLSNEQIALIKQQSGGVDYSSAITRNGYAVQYPLPTPQQRLDRVAPPINFWYANAGSVNHITFNTIFLP